MAKILKKKVKNQNIVKIRAPKGFNFKIKKYSVDNKLYSVLVGLYKNDKKSTKIGHVNLYKYNYNSFETHSRLDKSYRGKGYGAKMYARAIQWCIENGYKVRSSGESSNAAQRVWDGKTLRKYFSIRKRPRKLYSPFWLTPTWYAWSKNNNDSRKNNRRVV